MDAEKQPPYPVGATPYAAYASPPPSYNAPGAASYDAGYGAPGVAASYGAPGVAAGYGAPGVASGYGAPGYAMQPPYPPPAQIVVLVDPKSAGAPPGAPGAGAGASAGESFSAFMDRRVRHGFIAKVYAILSAQLLATFGVVAAFVFSPALAAWVQARPYILMVAMIANFGLMIALACFRENARRVPLNYTLLGAFTLTMSIMVGVISAQYTTSSVLIALGITVGMTLVLSAVACQSKYDFTVWLGAAVVALWSVIIFGLLMIWFRSQVLTVVYASVGALVFGLFIVIDTQMIVGGKHALQFSTDEYIFAALNLYLDIINLFLMLLRLFGDRR